MSSFNLRNHLVDFNMIVQYNLAGKVISQYHIIVITPTIHFHGQFDFMPFLIEFY